VARFRLSPLARADLASIVSTSEVRWGDDAKSRYIALLSLAMLKVASDPKVFASRDRSELSTGIRSFHIRHVRSADPAARVERPVHILFYRAIGPSVVEIVRVLHERMEPDRHIGTGSRRR